MLALSLIALAGAAFSAPAAQTTQESEDVWFLGGSMVVGRDSETSVVGTNFTLQPSGAVCAASNFSMPSPTFQCGDSGYSFSLDKVAGLYSRYTVHISRAAESG
jgi:hypothetical protein